MKKVIGSFAKVSFPDFGIHNVVAKVDTGATSGSLHAVKIKEINLETGEKALSFRPYGRKRKFTVTNYSLKEVRSSNGAASLRYAIQTTVVVSNVQYPINITLADRSQMKKAVLIGRQFLRSHGFLVDSNRGSQYRGHVK